MPKLPKFMVRKGKAYYYRRKSRGRDCFVPLGSKYDEAYREFKALRDREVVDPGLTVTAAAKRWLEIYCKTTQGPKTRRLTAQRVRDYLNEYLGPRPVSTVTAEDLRAYRLWLEPKMSLGTVVHVLADVRCFLYWCVENGYLDRAPVPKRLLPRLQERPPDRLSDEEIEQLAALPDPYGRVVRFLVGTGLRWGEASRAQSSDIENGLLVVSMTKTGRVRRVPLPEEFRRYVGRYVPFENPGTFAQSAGGRAGVKFHVHQLRHSFACRWLEQGGSLPALQQILGHTTIVTTQRYARLSDESVRQEAERLAGKSGKMVGR